MEEERQEEQEQRAMAVQAGARCRLGNYLGWLAQDLVSQRLLFSLSCFCSVVFARSHVCLCGKGAPSALVRLFTAGTRPLFWIQTEVPIFRKESCIIRLGETCL